MSLLRRRATARRDQGKAERPQTILDRIRKSGVAAVVKFVKPDHPEPETSTLTGPDIRKRRREKLKAERREKRKHRKRGKRVEAAEPERERLPVILDSDTDTDDTAGADPERVAWWNRPGPGDPDGPELHPPFERLGELPTSWLRGGRR